MYLDHVTVMAYLDDHEAIGKLTLHLPTLWNQDEKNPHFYDNDNSNIWKNPGRSANRLHKQFSAKMKQDTLQDIQSAILMGARYHVHDGFKARNTAVARDSKYLIAFTWNEGDTPKEESGTYDTWNKHSGRKIHVPIGSLLDDKEQSLKPRTDVEPSTCLESASTNVAESSYTGPESSMGTSTDFNSGVTSSAGLEKCDSVESGYSSSSSLSSQESLCKIKRTRDNDSTTSGTKLQRLQ